MSEQLPEMKKPITLLFKIGTDKYRAFKILGWKVRAVHEVVVDDKGASTCECSVYRFESKCDHSQCIEAIANDFVYGRDDWRKAETPIDWKSLAKGQACAHVVDGKVGVIDPNIGDISAFDLAWLLNENTKTDEIDKKMTDETSFFNPHRIFHELTASNDNMISLIDDEVKKAGAKVPVITKDEVRPEMEFDENLSGEEIEAPEIIIPPEGAIDWRNIKRPDPKHFYVNASDWQQLVYTAAEGGCILLTGPSGCGKSELIWLVGKATGLPVAAFNFGAMQEPRSALMGNTHFDKEKGTWFAKSEFVRAVEEDRGILLMDELTRDRGGASHNILLPLMDRQGIMRLDEAEDAPVIKRGTHIAFMSTANIGMEYTGTEALDQAMLCRQDVVIDLGWPPKEYEVKILMSRCRGLRARDSSRLVDIATRQRAMSVNDGAFQIQISTRHLLAAGKRVAAGFSIDDAIKYCVANHFSGEGGESSERTQVMQICQKNAA